MPAGHDGIRNGSELTSHALQDWARERGIALRCIAPGKPHQNAFIERFNKTHREETLSAYLFETPGRVPPLTYMPRGTGVGKSGINL
jgi:putative transposase